MGLLDTVLTEIRLSPKEYAQVLSRAGEFMGYLKKQAALHSIKARPVLGGSAAKGTLTRGDFDCDIFMVFDENGDISSKLRKILEGLDAEVLHGSRDYFEVHRHGLRYEIVPVRRCKKGHKPDNVTDMSVLHTDWMLGKIRETPGLRDEIIIAKAFCKAQGVYGAESYIAGFSGHVLDILVACYGSFLGLLKASLKWKPYFVIDIENHGAGLNRSKISPLIVIDPIDPERNAAAALGRDKLQKFREQARQFLISPSRKYFRRKTQTPASIQKSAGRRVAIILEALPGKGKRDVIGARLLKVYVHIRKQLALHGFTVSDSGWQWGKSALMWYYVTEKRLPERKVHQGPPARSGNAARFREKHPGCYEKNGRLFAVIKRTFTEPKELADSLILGSYVTEKVAGIRRLK